MNYDKVMFVVYRIFAVGSLALIALAVIETAANGMGYTVIQESYRPGRLVEFAAMSAVIAIALLLRQIRDDLRRKA